MVFNTITFQLVNNEGTMLKIMIKASTACHLYHTICYKQTQERDLTLL